LCQAYLSALEPLHLPKNTTCLIGLTTGYA